MVIWIGTRIKASADFSGLFVAVNPRMGLVFFLGKWRSPERSRRCSSGKAAASSTRMFCVFVNETSVFARTFARI